jgi:hypothetical protein
MIIAARDARVSQPNCGRSGGLCGGKLSGLGTTQHDLWMGMWMPKKGKTVRATGLARPADHQ